MSDTPINLMGEVYIESAWRMAVGVCIQPTCHTDGITPTGEQCRRAFVSRERFDEHIAPLLQELAKAQADLTDTAPLAAKVRQEIVDSMLDILAEKADAAEITGSDLRAMKGKPL